LTGSFLYTNLKSGGGVLKGEIEISAEIPVGLYYRLAELAAVSGMTLEETLRQAIKNFLKEM